MDADTAVDVAVVGGGIGGLTAALTAQDEGARVVLLEKAARVGGSAAASGGTLWCAKDLASWTAVQPGGDVALGRALVDGFHRGIPWIERQGVALRLLDEAVPYRIPRLVYNMEPDATAAMAQLARRFVERGGAIRTGTALINLLLTEEGGVRGVRSLATGALGTAEVRAGAVVLATGGFQGSAALRARHMGRWSDRMVVRANPDSTGDGLQAALRVGAAEAGAFDRFYGHMLPAPPARIGLHNFAQVKPDFSETAIFVNRHGARFDDESLGDEVSVHAAIHQPEAEVFLVYDDAIRAAVSRAALDPIAAGRAGADRIENIRAAGGEILDATSIEDLSLQMQSCWGVSAAGLRDTITAYNAAARAGTGAHLRPPKSGACVPLNTAPYYAVHLVVGITFTYGGIRTDAQARVLTAAGAPVPGLFVAGADAGGVYTRGYTGGLVLGLAFGRLAGRHAARYAAQVNPHG